MVTKRQLGLIFIALGIIGMAGSFYNDIFGDNDFQGIGPAQRLVLLLMLVVITVGVSLLPLGDRPA